MLLTKNDTALFPDTVTSRGLKHLIELQQQVSVQDRCVMFYLIQRMDAKRFSPAHHIDPAYGQALKQAVMRGVGILVYDDLLDLEGSSVNNPIPCEL